MFTVNLNAIVRTLCATALLLCHSAWADDTEIFYSDQFLSNEAPAQSNILFVIDTSGSMQKTDGTSQSRIDRVKQAMQGLLNDLSGVNVALMRMNVRQGGAIIAPMQNIDGAHPITGQPNRTALIETVNNIELNYSTPTVDALLEAARYYRGDAVVFGKTRGDGDAPANAANHNGREKARLSHIDSYTGGQISRPAGCTASNPDSIACREELITGNAFYQSPITDQCFNNNYIVLITDGMPTHNNSITDIESMVGTTCAPAAEVAESDGKKKKKKKKDKKKKGDNSDDNTLAARACGAELLEFLYRADQSSHAGVQNIVTHTIGLQLNDGWLQELAVAGGGSYHTVDSAQSLSEAFNGIVSAINANQMTFVSPTATVTNFNRLNHRNELFFTLFSPSDTEIWPGNVKSFKLNDSGIIVDKNGNPAVDPSTGQLFSTATSFWSTTPDGANLTDGGAAAQLPLPAARNIYTHLSDAISARLTHSDNHVTAQNLKLTSYKLGVGSELARRELIQWVRGIDTEDEDEDGNRSEVLKRLFDPLHSQANLVVYDQSEDNFKGTVFYGDNGGFLRALDAETGAERFAFIPEDLLSNLPLVKNNAKGVKSVYGVDGPISVWMHDEDKNGIIERAKGDHVYLYFGLRRGGPKNPYGHPATDDAILAHLDNDNRNRYTFKYKSHRYYLQKLGNNIAAYREDRPGVAVDSDVQINSSNTVDGFVEIRGLTGLPSGQALYIGFEPASGNKPARFSMYEASSNLDAPGNPQGASPQLLKQNGKLLNRGDQGQIYALDITDMDEPSLLWTIKGGEGDFEDLGQTWSRLGKTQVRIGETIEDVLVFAGGYDVDQDNATTRTPDDLGRAVYMIRARTGEVLWSAGYADTHALRLPKMRYSIPGDVRLIDVDGDKLLDQFYLGDMGGQLWRFDVDNNQTTGISIRGGVIADIAQDDSPSATRRFYTSPDAVISQVNGRYQLMLAIGTGYRAHPLNRTVEDRFYVFRSSYISSVPETYNTLTEANLYDATRNDLGERTGAALSQARSLFNSKEGWFIRLEAPGEKVLSNATTTNGVTYFTTYVPHAPGSSGEFCQVAAAGSSRLYAVRTDNAMPTPFHTPPLPGQPLLAEDRYADLATAGIPASPLSIKVANESGNLVEEKVQICVGLECKTTAELPQITPVYWRFLQ